MQATSIFHGFGAQMRLFESGPRMLARAPESAVGALRLEVSRLA